MFGQFNRIIMNEQNYLAEVAKRLLQRKET